MVARRPWYAGTLLTVLGTGAVLDAWERVRGTVSTPAILASFMISGLLLFPLSEGELAGQRSWSVKRGSRLTTPRSVLLSALLGSGLLLWAETSRFVRRGSHDGYPIWLSDLFHEDNSSWIAFGTTSAEGIRLPALNFGHGFALTQGAFNGLGVLYSSVRGVAQPALGSYVSGVGFAYIFLLLSVPCLTVPLMRNVYIRTGSLIASIAVGAALSMFLVRFMQEARDLGHLTAGFAVLALICSATLAGADLPRSDPEVGRAGSLWAFAFSCLLWFPLRPLALVYAVLACVVDYRLIGAHYARGLARTSAARLCLRSLVFLPSVVLRTWPDLRSYVTPELRVRTRALVNADGGTYAPVDMFLIVTAVLVGVVLLSNRIGSRWERICLTLLALYAIGIRLVDQLGSPTFEYGSTKLLWIVTPVLVFFASCLISRDLRPYRGTQPRFGAVFVVAGLLFMNTASFYGTVRMIGPLIWKDVRGSFAASSGEMSRDDLVQWDEPGGIDLTMGPLDLPVVCVAVSSETAPIIPLWDFEPYRCSRKMSEVSLEHARSQTGGGVDELWKSYALLDASLGEALFGSLSSGTDLSRNALVLDEQGQIVRLERIVDLLAQIALADAVSVSTLPSWSGPMSGQARYSLDYLNLEEGFVGMWVDNSVKELIFINPSSLENSPFSESYGSPRLSRPDVSEVLGRANLYSGLSISYPAINLNLRCIVLVDRYGQGTLVEESGTRCE